MPGRDTAGLDTVVIEGDARPDAPASKRDGGPDVAPSDAATADSMKPPACKGTLVLGVSPVSQIGKVRAIALGDLDGDGELDIAAAGDSQGVGVSLGQGGGVFSAETLYPTAYDSISVALGDLNGDGKLDIVTASASKNMTSVLLGKGDGTFGANTDYPLGTDRSQDRAPLVLGDLNADGKPDLVAVDHVAGKLYVFLGKGDGTLASKQDYATGLGPSAVALQDLNGDGKLDLATVNTKSSTVSVLLGEGDGTFADQLESPISGGKVWTNASIAAGDLNGDGKLDLVAAIHYPGAVSVLLGKGDGTFAAPASIAAAESLSPLVLRDLDGDGELDLVIPAYTGGVSVLSGRGDGTFAVKAQYPTARSLYTLALADLNGDAKEDLVLVSTGVEVRFGNGDATFAGYPAYATGGTPYALVLGDLNGDGKLDLASANTKVSSVSVLLGKGEGDFAAKKDYATGEWPVALALGDLNGDGKPDLVTANQRSDTVSVLAGAGDGTFAAKTDLPVGSYPTALALGDLDGDGTLDMVVTGDEGGTSKGIVSVLLGTAGGKLAARVDYPAGASPASLALGDVNGDRKLDLVVANLGNEAVAAYGSVGLMLGRGDGTFDPMVQVSGTRETLVALAELNGDSNLDIVLAWGVMLGLGDGTFAPRVSYPGSGQGQSLAAGDLDGDGVMDMVVGSSTSMNVLPAKADGTLAPMVEYAVGAATLALGDLNGDGRLDVVAGGDDAFVGVLLGACR